MSLYIQRAGECKVLVHALCDSVSVSVGRPRWRLIRLVTSRRKSSRFMVAWLRGEKAELLEIRLMEAGGKCWVESWLLCLERTKNFYVMMFMRGVIYLRSLEEQVFPTPSPVEAGGDAWPWIQKSATKMCVDEGSSYSRLDFGSKDIRRTCRRQL